MPPEVMHCAWSPLRKAPPESPASEHTVVAVSPRTSPWSYCTVWLVAVIVPQCQPDTSPDMHTGVPTGAGVSPRTGAAVPLWRLTVASPAKCGLVATQLKSVPGKSEAANVPIGVPLAVCTHLMWLQSSSLEPKRAGR